MARRRQRRRRRTSKELSRLMEAGVAGARLLDDVVDYVTTRAARRRRQRPSVGPTSSLKARPIDNER